MLNEFFGTSLVITDPAAAGSVITKDVPKNSLSIARSDQKNLLGRAKEIMRKLKKIKTTTEKANR